jgi:DNA-binding SARP family transcriptional activator/tetratricopeptide (TPR) repeat protein
MPQSADRARPEPKVPSRRAAVVRLVLQGDPRVQIAGGQVVALERRAAALCALAALESGCTRERAALWLWPDSDDPRRNLRQQVLRFRKGLGQSLLAEGDLLALAPEVQLAAPDPGAPLLGQLEYADSPQFAVWLAARRSHDRVRQTAQLRERISLAEAQGDLDAALAAGEALLAADPDAEAAHRELMRLHYLRGDSAAGLAVHQRLVRRLAHTHHARPHADTEVLAQALRDAAVPEPAPQRSVLPTLQRPPRLIGRERELAAVHDGWGAGAVVLLLGEAGMGKSRLIAEMAREWRLAVVQGRPGDAGIPYATMARLLREALPRAAHDIAPEQRRELARVLPELAPTVPLPADGQRLVLQHAVRQVLSGAAVKAVAVDDLHFADDASIEMLLALAGDGGPGGPCWLFAQRPAEGGAAAVALHDTLQEAGTLRSVALEPLDGAAMVALIDSLGLRDIDAAALAPQLVRHTGGNPLYALETLKQALATDGVRLGQLPRPVSVGGLIERRIRQLSERALALARVAAIAGVDFSVALAEEVMGLRAVEFTSAFGELEFAGVLRDEAFAHDLVYDAVLCSIPPPIARHLHAAVAAQLGRRDGVPARVAAHWLAAQADREALPWLGRAAQQARTGLRRREELQFLLTQADIEERLGERAAAFETYKLAHTAQLAAGQGDAGLRLIFEALRRLALTPEQRIDIDDMRASDYINEGRHADAEALARRTLASAGHLGYDRGSAASMSTLSMALSMQGRLAEALAVVEENWPLVDRLPDPDPDFFNTRAVLLDNLGRPREAIPLHRQVFELTLRRSASGDAVTSLGNLAVSLMECGLMRGAQRALERAEALRRAHDDGDSVSPVMMLQALAVARALGHHDHALAWADRVHGCLALSGSAYLPLVGLGRAAVWTDLGQFARAQQALPEADALQGMPSWFTARRWQYAARLRAAQGRNPLECAEAAAAALGDENLVGPRESVTLQLATARGAAGDLDTIFAVAASARASGRDGIALAADLRAAELAAVLGMLHVAATHADRARALLAGDREGDDAVTAADLSDAESWLMLGHAYAAAGRSVDATDACARGAQWVAQTASDHVAPEFRDSFLHRNPVHRDLLAASAHEPVLAGQLVALRARGAAS